jgi:hypothetical protein
LPSSPTTYHRDFLINSIGERSRRGVPDAPAAGCELIKSMWLSAATPVATPSSAARRGREWP